MQVTKAVAITLVLGLSDSAIFKMYNQQGPTSTGNSAQCYVAAWNGGEIGGGWIHVYVFAVHLKLLQHC